MFTMRECHQSLAARLATLSAFIFMLSLSACSAVPCNEKPGGDSGSGELAVQSTEDEESDPQQDIASAVPDTDIFVFHIDQGSSQIVVSFDANVTSRNGYDNQPGYIPGTNDFLFSSILDGRQSDVYRYSEASGKLTQLTRTDLSEYSPTSLTGGGFSTVVVEADGTQRLWLYNQSGVATKPVRGDVTGVGYHTWLPNDQLAVFIVDEPLMHLDVVGVTGEARYTLAVNPGRSLHARPGTESLSFVQHRDNEISRLMNWDGTKVEFLVNMPEGVEDMTWLPDGRALTVAGGQLMVWTPGSTQWVTQKDLSNILPGEVTRLAVNSTATRLAVVSSMSPPEPQ